MKHGKNVIISSHYLSLYMLVDGFLVVLFKSSVFSSFFKFFYILKCYNVVSNVLFSKLHLRSFITFVKGCCFQPSAFGSSTTQFYHPVTE